MKAFVYGTLKRGHSNNRLLDGAAFIGEAVTVDHFAMVDVGFPFLLRSPQRAPAAGELFDIGDDTRALARLDRLESEGRMYDRVIGVVECNGRRHRASYYVKCHRDGAVRGDPIAPNARGLLEWEGHR